MQSKSKKTLFILLILTFFCALSCKNSDSKKKSSQLTEFESAAPHGKSLPKTQLTPEEQSRLLSAKGKTAIEFQLNELDSMFKYSEGLLHVYSFYKTDSLTSQQQNQALLSLQQEWSDSMVQVIFVSLDSPEHLPKLNTFIRENDVTSNVLYTSDSLTTDWFSNINPSWGGDVPAIYLKNNGDGTALFYQDIFSKEELNTLIEPFLLTN